MKLEINVSQKLLLTPQLRAAIEILQMSALELKQKIQAELQDNPFLDEDLGGTADDAEEEGGAVEKKEEEPAIEEDYFQDSSDRGYVRKGARSDDFIEGTVSRPDSLKEHLMWQLRLTVNDAKRFAVGEQIIGNINDDGFLVVPLDELAGFLKVTVKDVEDVLKVVQGFEPYGVAARDLRESLLNQLGRLQPRDPWAERVVRDHFELLIKRKIPQIVRLLGVSERTVSRSLEVIGKLNPKPGQEYDTKGAVYVIPDVIVKRIDEKFVVFINDPMMPRINLNSYYDNMLRNYTKKDSTQKFLEEKCVSALWLLRSIEQRRLTIYKVVNHILKYQLGFFQKGSKFLAPLTLRTIADAIEMHESTISRVTHNKYIQTPWGIFELKYFFSSRLKNTNGDDFSSRSVKEIIRDIVTNEESALSDAALVTKLNGLGIQISRRTVTKYRKFLRILPSYLRKK